MLFQMEQERDFLEKQLSISKNESEDIERDLRRLRHEKDVAARKLRNLTEEYHRLHHLYMSTELEVEHYRQSICAFRVEADEKIDGVCTRLCNTIDENRVLLKHALESKTPALQHRFTEDYLELQAKKMRIYKQLEKQVTRLVKQELFINDLELELAVAINKLQGIGVTVNRSIIGKGPKYLEKFAVNDTTFTEFPEITPIVNCVTRKTTSEAEMKKIEAQKKKDGAGGPGAAHSSSGTLPGNVTARDKERKGLMDRVKGKAKDAMGESEKLMGDKTAELKQEAAKKAVGAAPQVAAKGCCASICPCCC